MCFKGKQFLSLNFRRIFDIFLIECDYRTESNKIYAILKHSVVGGTEIKRCLVLTEALNVFLRTTSQLLLYGIRSHKYSERFLNKFGLRKSNKKYRSDRKDRSSKRETGESQRKDGRAARQEGKDRCRSSDRGRSGCRKPTDIRGR